MKLNKTWKIILGLVTGWVTLYPFMMVAFMFVFMLPTMLSLNSTTSAPPPALFAGFFTFVVLIMFSSLLQIATSGFYLAHIIKNKTGSELLRILCGLGAFYLPYIALPAYYLIFILPQSTPDWALEKPHSGTIE